MKPKKKHVLNYLGPTLKWLKHLNTVIGSVNIEILDYTRREKRKNIKELSKFFVLFWETKTLSSLHLLSQPNVHVDFKSVYILVVALNKIKCWGYEIGEFRNGKIWKVKNLEITVASLGRHKYVLLKSGWGQDLSYRALTSIWSARASFIWLLFL